METGRSLTRLRFKAIAEIVRHAVKTRLDTPTKRLATMAAVAAATAVPAFAWTENGCWSPGPCDGHGSCSTTIYMVYQGAFPCPGSSGVFALYCQPGYSLASFNCMNGYPYQVLCHN